MAKAAQIPGGNAAGPPRLAGGTRLLIPCRTGMPALRAAAVRVPTGMPVSVAMSLRLRCRTWYCSFSHCGDAGGLGYRAGRYTVLRYSVERYSVC